MTENEKIAAELVANFDRPAVLRSRKKRADFIDNIKQLASGAGRQAVDYLKDPENVAVRNATIGAGAGGLIGGLGSTRGRRGRDAIRGALLGGTIGGAGTMAYNSLIDTAKNTTQTTVPTELMQDSEPEQTLGQTVANMRPATIGAGTAIGGKLVADQYLANQPQTLRNRLSTFYGIPARFGLGGGAFPEAGRNPTYRQQKNVIDRYMRELRGLDDMQKTKSLDAFKELMIKEPRNAYEILREASNELDKAAKPGAKSPVTTGSATRSKTFKPERAGNYGVTLEKAIDQHRQARGANPVFNHPDRGSAYRGTKVEIGQPSRFNRLLEESTGRLEKDVANRLRQLTPGELNQTAHRPRGSRFRRGLAGAGGAAGIAAGYFLEPKIWGLLGSGANMLSRPQQLTPEQVKFYADEYLKNNP